jgi:exonuclease III
MNFYSCINANCNYYTDEEFNDNMRDSLPKYGLTMIHLNCRSLVKYFGKIRNFLRNIILKFDIVALSETWLIPDQHDLNDYKYEGYTMYSTSITTKNGGGVALLVI